MPVTGTTKDEKPPLPPFGKGGMGGFSYKTSSVAGSISCRSMPVLPVRTEMAPSLPAAAYIAMAEVQSCARMAPSLP